jgi:hypothetical protein
MKLDDYALKVEKFIPLTYLEAKQKKPLIFKLSDKWNFVTHPQSAFNFALLINRKDYVKQIYGAAIDCKDGTLRSTQIIMANKQLIGMLFELSKQEYPDKEKEYGEFLYNYFLENTEAMFEIFQTILDQNTRIEKKNAVPDELQGISTPGPVDSWSGLFGARTDIESKTFIELIIEWEEETRSQIREYKNAKKKKKERPGFKHSA